MPWIDFSHPISETIPVFPGTPAPQLHAVATCTEQHYHETALQLYSHMGTHADAPAHVFAEGRTLDQFPADHFIGSALIIPCAGLPIPIGMSALSPYETLAEEADFLFFSTGWEAYWTDPARYITDYPTLSPDIAFFAAVRHKLGVGIDTLSPDRLDRLDFHRRFLSFGDGIILENLCNLSAASGRLIPVCALPLFYEGSDGAPTRVIGFVE